MLENGDILDYCVIHIDPLGPISRKKHIKKKGRETWKHSKFRTFTCDNNMPQDCIIFKAFDTLYL
jgi:hypothetical protein